jgi:hypothetical protein
MIRRACLFTGMLAVLVQGSSGGHMLLVEHTQCVEHGELVHSGEAHRHQAADDVEADSQAFHGASDDGPEEAHGHCALSADHRTALIAIGDSQLATCVYEVRADLGPVSAFVATDNSRFRVAPKNSPPA